MLKHFVKRILIFSAIISSIAYFTFIYLIPKFYLQIFPFLILFFISTSVLVHYILIKTSKERIRKFSTFYMGSITAKLFIYIIFIAIYVITNKSTAIPFLITFLSLYFLYTFFDTHSLLSELKSQQSSKD
jgi:hypothetical protein